MQIHTFTSIRVGLPAAILGLLWTAAACSFDPAVGLKCEDGDYKGGLVCRNGGWEVVGDGGGPPDVGADAQTGSTGGTTGGTTAGSGSGSTGGSGSGSGSGSGNTGGTTGGTTGGSGSGGTTGSTGNDTGLTDAGGRDTGVMDTGVVEAPVGATCADNSDCKSGDCRSFDGVSRCTDTCTSGGCPPADMVCSTGLCMPNDYCDDSQGQGYGNGPGCKADKPPCAMCDPNATCKADSSGSKICVCNSGYAGDGMTCRPDSDGDGLSDHAETNNYQTDPQNPDTDRDGLSDGEEVLTYKTSPVGPGSLDSDGDYLPDGAEVNRHKTDPAKADTDGGGRADGVEVLIFDKDPTKAGDDGSGKPKGEGAASTWVDDRTLKLRNLRDAESTFYDPTPERGGDGVVHFVHGDGINFSSSGQTKGAFRKDDYDIEGKDVFDETVSNFTAAFSGLVYVPGSHQTSSWAVGSEDGFRMRLFDGRSLQEQKYDGLRIRRGTSVFDTGPLLRATMASAGAIHPFEVLFFAEPGDEGVELSWAPGRPNFKAPPYRLVPHTHIAAPELDVGTDLKDLNGGDLRSNDTVRWKVTVENKGQAYAWSVLFIPGIGRGGLNGLKWTKLPALGWSEQINIWNRFRPVAKLSYLAPGQKAVFEFEGRSAGQEMEARSHVFAAGSPFSIIDERRLRVLEEEELGD